MQRWTKTFLHMFKWKDKNQGGNKQGNGRWFSIWRCTFVGWGDE